MCGGCFKLYGHNKQLALHLAAEKARRLHEFARSPAVEEEVVSLQAADVVVSADAAAAAAGDAAVDAVDAAAVDAGVVVPSSLSLVLITTQIAARGREVKRDQIVDRFTTCLAFVRNINNCCERPVTREDVLKRQRWDIQAMNKDKKRRRQAKKKAAATAAGEDDDDDDDDDEFVYDSSSSEEKKTELKKRTRASRTRGR
jgi:hypothetical protein